MRRSSGAKSATGLLAAGARTERRAREQLEWKVVRKLGAVKLQQLGDHHRKLCDQLIEGGGLGGKPGYVAAFDVPDTGVRIEFSANDERLDTSRIGHPR